MIPRRIIYNNRIRTIIYNYIKYNYIKLHKNKAFLIVRGYDKKIKYFELNNEKL